MLCLVNNTHHRTVKWALGSYPVTEIITKDETGSVRLSSAHSSD